MNNTDIDLYVADPMEKNVPINIKRLRLADASVTILPKVTAPKNFY